MNTDLAYTLIGAFGIFFMGIIVYFHEKQSSSNRLFFLMSLSTVFWSLANYFSVAAEPDMVLVWARMVLFFAAPHAVLFFLFVYNFPEKKIRLRKPVIALIFIALASAMAAAVSSSVFSGMNLVNGRPVPVVGPLMPLFAFVVLGSLLLSIGFIVRKYIKARDIERVQWKYMLIGVFVSYILIIITNFGLVILFGNTFFVKFGPLFMLPAVIGMGYAILRHHLLNVKTITTETLTFAILSISLFEVFVSKNTLEFGLRIGFFGLFFIFGIFLIRSVLKEIEQKEQLEVLTKKLESANERLQELDHMKSEFLSFASHQIKAPLAAIKGFATLIFDGTYGETSEKVKDAAHKIKDSSDRMIQLVGDFLNVRKIEEGKMVYKLERVDVVKIVRNIFEELKLLAQNKKLDFSFEPSSDSGWINADPQNIRQVFQNLIENAIKYTDSGFVKVRTESIANKFIFSVSDSGHGISKELLPHLFEEFRRDALTTGKIEGTGLGLFIAHQITIDHGGEIWVESDGVGKGSKFIVKLPLA